MTPAFIGVVFMIVVILICGGISLARSKGNQNNG